MPLYEYQCPKCGRFELIVKFSDPALTACPTCGAEIQKLASAPAIQFKGTGWYITDYARKSKGGDGDGAKSSSESAAKEGSKDSASKDSGSKDSGKDSGSKDSGSRDSKDSGSRDSKHSGSRDSKDSGSKDTSTSPPSKSTSKDTAAPGSGSSK